MCRLTKRYTAIGGSSARHVRVFIAESFWTRCATFAASIVFAFNCCTVAAIACEGAGEEENLGPLVAVSPEIRIALKKEEENKNVIVSFENSGTKPIEIQKEPLLGGDAVSWAINPKAEQPANLCKITLIIIAAGTCSVKVTFKSEMKAKKEGAGNGYVATLTESAKKAGSATSKLNGEVTN